MVQIGAIAALLSLSCAIALPKGAPRPRLTHLGAQPQRKEPLVVGEDRYEPLLPSGAPVPGPENDFHGAWMDMLRLSLREVSGKAPWDDAVTAREIYEDLDAAVLSHNLVPPPDPAVGPIFNYGNRVAQEVFELDWADLVALPSRQSAEPGERAERQALLDAVAAQGYVEEEHGVRVSATGQRFAISAVVWNVLDDAGAVVGQAATFRRSELKMLGNRLDARDAAEASAPGVVSASADNHATDEAGVEGLADAAKASVGLASADEPGARTLASFRLMCLSFSANHACATAALSLASTKFGLNLGGLSSGVLYLAYTASALLLAGPAVNRLGPKNALTASLGLYCAYVAEFAVSSQLGGGGNEKLLLLAGSALGGLAAGVLWTAEGAYFSAIADVYREEADIAVGAGAEDRLRGMFAQFFLTGEVLVKLLTSCLLFLFPENVAFLALFVLAVAGAGGAFFVDAVEAKQPKDGGEASLGFRRVAKALVGDKRSFVLLPFNLAFGLGVAFLQLQVNGHVLAENPAMGAAAVGVTQTIATASAALSSKSLTALPSFSARFALGAAGFVALGAGFGFGFGPDQLRDIVTEYGYAFVAPLFVLWGLARSSWEGPFKAFFSELFPDEGDLAFSVTIVQSGLATAAGFLLFPYVDLQISGLLVSAAGALGLLLLLGAKQDIEARSSEAQ